MATTATAKKGYVNGSDLLVIVGTKAIGHCTSHTLTLTSETKERLVKPPKSDPITRALFKGKGVVGLAYSIQAEGLCFYNEEEYGYHDLFAAWKAGESVTVSCCERESDTAPYLKGACVITNLEATGGANDDATYSVSFENDGAPETIDESKITQTVPAS